MARVLVTDGHELAGLATARSVGRGGFEVVVAVPAGRNRDAVARSRYVSEVITSPDPWEDSRRYEDWLAARSADSDLAAVFPVSEASLVAAVALDGDEGLRGVPVVMPDADSRRLSLSKTHATRVAAEAGLTVPATLSWYADREFDDQAIASWTFPFLVKSDNCHTSVGTYRRGHTWMVRSSDELRSVRLGLSGLSCQAIVQQAVPGFGVSACFYVEDGVPLLTFGHRRMHEVPWTGGWSSLRASHHDPDVLAQGRVLLAHARYTGLAMVELRQDSDGPAFFLEVNGRPWGSLALALHAGADFPLLALQRTIERAAGHERTPLQASSIPGRRERTITCMNLVRGELDHLRSIARSSSLSKRSRRRLLARHGASTLRWIVDPRTRHDHLWWSDPGPGLAQLRVLAKLVRDVCRTGIRRLRRSAGVASETAPAAMALHSGATPVRSVLWICSGNLCRSPFTERMFAGLDTGIASRSAGLHVRDGVAIPDWVRGFYDCHVVPWSDHHSEPVTEDLVLNSDLIVGMEGHHCTELIDRFPAAAGKTWLIGELGGLTAPEVADPYPVDVSDAAVIYEQLVEATQAIAALLTGAMGAGRALRSPKFATTYTPTTQRTLSPESSRPPQA